MAIGQNVLRCWFRFKEKRFGSWKRQTVLSVLLHLCPFSPPATHKVKQSQGKRRDSCDSCLRVPYQMWPVMEALGIEVTISTALSGATGNTTHRPAPQSGLWHWKWLKSEWSQSCGGAHRLNPDLSSTIKHHLLYSKIKPESETLRYFYVAGDNLKKNNCRAGQTSR